MNRWDQLMGLALSEARRAGSHGDVPVGAVVVDQNGTLLAATRNERELTGDTTAHAEVVAKLRPRSNPKSVSIFTWLGAEGATGHCFVPNIKNSGSGQSA